MACSVSIARTSDAICPLASPTVTGFPASANGAVTRMRTRRNRSKPAVTVIPCGVVMVFAATKREGHARSREGDILPVQAHQLAAPKRPGKPRHQQRPISYPEQV